MFESATVRYDGTTQATAVTRPTSFYWSERVTEVTTPSSLSIERSKQGGGADAVSADVIAMKMAKDLRRFDEQVDALRKLPNDWDSYGAPPPSIKTSKGAKVALRVLLHQGLQPSRVTPSGEGGVALVFINDSRYADIEFLNTGDILAGFVSKATSARVLTLTSPDDVGSVVSEIRDHLRSHDAPETDATAGASG